MNWEIKNKIWKRKGYNKLISLVVSQIAHEFTKMIPAGPPLKCSNIIVINDLFWDHRIYWPLNPKFYKIGLFTGEKTFGKAAYQFSHELTHIYCDPRIINWFIETIAHVASFYILDLLTEKWESEPPENIPQGTYKIFRDYKFEIIREAYKKIDLVQHQVSGEWIKKEVKKMHKKRRFGNRLIYNIIALEILPIFKENPDVWSILPYLGKSSVPPPPENPKVLRTNKKTIPDFIRLKEILPEKLVPLWDKIIFKIWE